MNKVKDFFSKKLTILIKNLLIVVLISREILTVHWLRTNATLQVSQSVNRVP